MDLEFGVGFLNFIASLYGARVYKGWHVHFLLGGSRHYMSMSSLKGGEDDEGI